MPGGLRREDFAFLFQSEQGRIDRATWLRGAGSLLAVFAVATAGWLLLAPYSRRSLAERAFLDPMTITANVYLVVYAFAAMLVAISWVNLSAKRFRDRDKVPPLGLAGLLPFAALLDGAIRWLQPNLADTLPRWMVFVGDIAVFAVFLWTVLECADFLPLRRKS